ncbi:hypothetical protein HDU96_002620 [Phlyctochytrium bullatum]|nr:hypothetical protein HDU96_002620 [Phlyctochytrium bullatum]
MLCSLAYELLRNILLDLEPHDLIAVASVNRHLRLAVPACIDQALAMPHVTEIRYWEVEKLKSIPFDHPVLFEFTVAAIAHFVICPMKAEFIWGKYWLPGTLEAVRLHRTALAKLALALLGKLSGGENEKNRPSYRDGGLMKSLDLLNDVWDIYWDVKIMPWRLDSYLWTKFFFGCAKSGYCEGLSLIPQEHVMLLTIMINPDGMTLLQVATEAGHPPAMELLLARRYPDSQTSSVVMPPLFSVLSDYNLRILRFLLVYPHFYAGAADVHLMHENVTAVHRAASTGQHKALKMLIDFDAKPDTLDAQGRTALFDAAFFGHAECVVALLNAGANVNALDPEGRTPLMSACLGGHVDVVRILVDRGAHVNHASIDNCYPLHAAATASGDMAGVVKALLEAGAQVNPRNRDGKTPLYLAMETHDPAALLAVVTLLLDAGADPTIKSNAGLVPLTLFPVNVTWNTQWLDLLDRFIKKGANLHAKTRSGETVWQKLCTAALKNPRLRQWLNDRIF